MSNHVLVQKEAEGRQTHAFRTEAQALHSVKVDSVDFAEVEERLLSGVNAWVKHCTKGHVHKMLDSAPASDSSLVILNTSYFKGKWAKPFDKELTEKMPFYSLGQRESHASFMAMYGKPFQYAVEEVAGEKIQIVEIPYADSCSSMLIFLPERIDGLRNMLLSQAFVRDTLKLLSSLATEKTMIDLFLPKFRIESDVDLKPCLSAMDMEGIFAPAADFSDISPDVRLHVTDMRQKAVVEMDEEGTEVPVVTAMMVMRCCMVEVLEEIEYKADHPFLYVIMDRKSGLVFFIGKVESL